MRIPPFLVQRCKQHIHNLVGASVIFGLNGFVWIAQQRSDESEENTGGFVQNINVRAVVAGSMLLFDRGSVPLRQVYSVALIFTIHSFNNQLHSQYCTHCVTKIWRKRRKARILNL